MTDEAQQIAIDGDDDNDDEHTEEDVSLSGKKRALPE
jgi:hypothetical protein